MHGLKVEHRPLPNETYLAKDIAAHIAKEQSYKSTVIVTDKPKQLMAEIKQEWNILLEQYKQQKTMTDDRELKEKLAHRIAYMQNRTFTAKPPGEVLTAHITLATPKDLQTFVPICQLMYVATDIKQNDLYMLTAMMFEGGVVVDYR